MKKIRIPLVLLLLTGILTGVLTNEKTLMVPVVLLFSGAVLFLAGAHRIPVPDRRFLTVLGLWALLARLLFIVATHSFDTPFISYIRTSDALYYEHIGRVIAGAWQEGSNIIVPSSNYGYFYWNGLIYFLVGFKPDIVRILNCVTALGVGLNLYFISLRLGGSRAAKTSFVLAVFFPSFILWSSLNLKESLVIFLITLIVKQNLELMERFAPGKVLSMAVLLVPLVSLRFYAGILLAICVALSYIFTATRFLLWQRLIYSLAIFLAAGLVLQQMGYGFLGTDYVFNQSIETIGEQHQRAAYGEAAYAGDVVFRSYGDALRYLPRGIFYFLFAPLPWQAMGPLRFITIPEMVLLYFLYVYFTAGTRHLWQVRRGDCLFLLVVIGLFGLIYSLGSSNMGGLYRVRLQVIMIAFIFISAGMQRSRALNRISWRLSRKRLIPQQ
ncbi:MAG: hypothetical protein HPY89_04225 [Pelotomaculum sp.]|nr:hypothetical protein [Pelotomaculum sp.]